MNRLLAASAMLALAAMPPAHAGGSPPRHEISIKNNTSYPLIVFFYNNDDTVKMFEASRVQLASGESGNGFCNTNGSCYLQACVSVGQNFATTASQQTGLTNCDTISATHSTSRFAAMNRTSCASYTYHSSIGLSVNNC